MKDKIIKRIIRKKIIDWVKSIEDEKLREDIYQDCIVTGGAIVSLMLNEKPKDYDVYFKTRETVKKVAKYYIKKFNEKKKGSLAFLEERGDDKRLSILVEDEVVENIVERSDDIPEEIVEDIVERADDIPEEELEGDVKEENEKYVPVFLSPNAITLSNGIQVVIRFYGTPREIHKTFDFVHCTAWYRYRDNKLDYTKKCIRSILNKELIYIGSQYPICSVMRTRKFIKRGWKINAGQYLKMLFQVSELNLKDINVLKEQLIGVDTTYFMMLINALEKKIEDDNAFEVDTEYICSIIDKIF